MSGQTNGRELQVIRDMLEQMNACSSDCVTVTQEKHHTERSDVLTDFTALVRSELQTDLDDGVKQLIEAGIPAYHREKITTLYRVESAPDARKVNNMPLAASSALSPSSSRFATFTDEAKSLLVRIRAEQLKTTVYIYRLQNGCSAARDVELLPMGIRCRFADGADTVELDGNIFPDKMLLRD
jgi:hypothetical protein